MNNNIFVFDRQVIQQKRNRAAPNFKDHSFLFDWSIDQIKSRLEDIKREFPIALQIGNRAATNLKSRYGIKDYYTLDLAQNFTPSIIADEELLPFGAQSFNLVLSPLNLHTTND